MVMFQQRAMHLEGECQMKKEAEMDTQSGRLRKTAWGLA